MSTRPTCNLTCVAEPFPMYTTLQTSCTQHIFYLNPSPIHSKSPQDPSLLAVISSTGIHSSRVFPGVFMQAFSVNKLKIGFNRVSIARPRVRHSDVSTHAMKLFVKGIDGKLGDCPFCHRALLTLELKVRQK